MRGQQDGEQLLELEVRERLVHHRLDVLDALPRTLLGLESARVGDRGGGAIGGQLQQVDVVVGEGAVGERADVQHADHLARARAAAHPTAT